MGNAAWREDRYRENAAQSAAEISYSEGPGITRADPKARTKPFRVRIRLDGYRSMTLSFDAENKTKALQYAQARWPNAKCEVLL